MNCKRCGKNVPIHSKVCPECGLSNPAYVPRTEEKTTSYSSYSARPTSQPKATPTYSSTSKPKTASTYSTASQPKTTTTYSSASKPKTATTFGSASQPKAAPNPGPTQAQQAADAAKSQGQNGGKPASAGSNSSLKNFLILAVVVIGIILLLKNCDTMRLKGTWEASDGSSITFSDKDSGYIVARGTMGSATMNFTYFVDGDELEIKTADSLYAYSTVVRFAFEIDGSTLYLTDLDSGLMETFRKK